MRVKYFCTQAESFDSRQTPGLKRTCAKCNHRFYCLTTKFIRSANLITNNGQIIAAAGANWSGHVGFRMGGQRYDMELKRIEAKFGIDLHLNTQTHLLPITKP